MYLFVCFLCLRNTSSTNTTKITSIPTTMIITISKSTPPLSSKKEYNTIFMEIRIGFQQRLSYILFGGGGDPTKDFSLLYVFFRTLSGLTFEFCEVELSLFSFLLSMYMVPVTQKRNQLT